MADQPKWAQEQSHDSSESSQKSRQQLPKSCRPHWPQLRSVIMAPPWDRDWNCVRPKQNIWESGLWTDKVKVELFWKVCVTLHQTVPAVKHGGGSVMVWKKVSELFTHEFFCPPTNPERERLAICSWPLAEAHSDLKRNKMKTLQWPSQNPDLNLTEILWHDLKYAVHARKASKVATLDEWRKILHSAIKKVVGLGDNHFYTQDYVGLDFFPPLIITTLI